MGVGVMGEALGVEGSLRTLLAPGIGRERQRNGHREIKRRGFRGGDGCSPGPQGRRWSDTGRLGREPLRSTRGAGRGGGGSGA